MTILGIDIGICYHNYTKGKCSNPYLRSLSKDDCCKKFKGMAWGSHCQPCHGFVDVSSRFDNSVFMPRDVYTTGINVKDEQ